MQILNTNLFFNFVHQYNRCETLPVTILFIVVMACSTFTIQAQGINYPGNVPSSSGGAGNARTDADNLFTRNNAAAMTEIEDVDITTQKSKWRFMGEAQGVYYHYQRKYTPGGFGHPIQSAATIALPTLSGEITYTAKNNKYAVGIGLSQTFGFQSKLKDPEQILGNQAQFYDTKVASNDLTFAGAMRLHRKLSIGAAFTVGRGFLVQIAPVPQLSALGIIKQSRLDVSQIGAPGLSISAHLRPSKKLSFGFNYKTARKYDLQGILDTVQPIVSATGLQLLPLQLPVKVPFKIPSIVESGVNIQPTKRFFIDLDYRFYRYSKALDNVTVLDRQSRNNVFTQSINARDVHLFLAGGTYILTESSKIFYGAGFTTNALSDSSFSPGLNNSGGISISGGFGKRISGIWFNIGATGIVALNRKINVAPQNLFPGEYKSQGFIIGFGVRL